MKNKTDDELAALGWAYVARDHHGEAVYVTSDKDTDHMQQIMEWLGKGFTVNKLF